MGPQNDAQLEQIILRLQTAIKTILLDRPDMLLE